MLDVLPVRTEMSPPLMLCLTKTIVDFTFSKCAELAVWRDKPSDIFCLPGASYTLTAENGYFSPGSHFLLSPRLSLQQSPQNAFLIALTILFIALDKDTLPIHKTCFLLIKAFILKLFVLVKNKITISFIDIIQAASN
ncbi:hypothetical protein WHU24_23125 [Escherichia coli]